MVLWLPCVMVRPLDLLGLDDHNRRGNPLSPCKQSLLYSSSVRRRRRRKRGSARQPELLQTFEVTVVQTVGLGKSCFPSSNCFFWFKHPFIDLLLKQARGY